MVFHLNLPTQILSVNRVQRNGWLQAEIQTDRVTECQRAISRDQKEETLDPVWELVCVHAVCAERVSRNMKCTHRESFHVCFLSNCKHVSSTKMAMIKGKETERP